MTRRSPPSAQSLPPLPPPSSAIGYAIGAALAGMIANVMGFSGGYTKEAAANAAPLLFYAFLPLALYGCWAAWRASGAPTRLDRIPGLEEHVPIP